MLAGCFQHWLWTWARWHHARGTIKVTLCIAKSPLLRLHSTSLKENFAGKKIPHRWSLVQKDSHKNNTGWGWQVCVYQEQSVRKCVISRKSAVNLSSVRKRGEKTQPKQNTKPKKPASGFNAKMWNEAGSIKQEAANAWTSSSSHSGGTLRVTKRAHFWAELLLHLEMKSHSTHPEGGSPQRTGWLASPLPSKKRPIISLPSSVVRFWRHRRDKWKINPWSTNYLRTPLLVFNKCCNGGISHAKCPLDKNCMIRPFQKLLSSATHQQGGWKCQYRRNGNGSSSGKLNSWKSWSVQ